MKTSTKWVNILSFFMIVAVYGCNAQKRQQGTQKPNIVIFYVDDLGYGDVSCYGATSLETPNVDRLAKGGVRFIDGHSSSATCTPSRYSLLTGEHAFRKNAGILPGDAPLLISPTKATLPKMLKKAGYATGVVGKWHLGLGEGNVDWNEDVIPGPLEIGFDYSFLLPSTGDRVPCVYLENYKVVNLSSDDPLQVSYKKKVGNRPTGKSNPELLRYKADGQHAKTIINGVSRIGYMAGGQSAEWVDEDFPTVFSQKAEKFISTAGDDPFFLFFSFHDIHVPRLPNDDFKGKSAMGVRGDAILQMDWTVGEVMRILKDKGIEENTLVIFTSDNGPVLYDGYQDESVERLGDHKPAGVFRGGKYSVYEAGTRVPTILYWPSEVKPVVSEGLMSQIDLYASFAAMLDIELDENEAIDSENHLDFLLGKKPKGRTHLIEEGETLAITSGGFKYIPAIPEEKRIPGWIKNSKNIESGLMYNDQLYNLKEDPSESTNIADTNPEVVNRLNAELRKREMSKSRTDTNSK